MALDPRQLHYLESILDKSEEELLFEVAHGATLGIVASAQGPQTRDARGPRPPSLEEIRRWRNVVPSGPITEYQKPASLNL